MVGLHHEYLKPFSDYSLGMKQRLGIADITLPGQRNDYICIQPRA
jgi:ABC-type multidrug transport system ATPase subunit